MALLNPFKKFAALRAHACRIDALVDAGRSGLPEPSADTIVGAAR